MTEKKVSYELASCPVCGGTASDEVADREDIRRELELLWGFHLRRLRPGVPVRHLFDRAYFSQAPPLRVARCAECGTLFRNPREEPEALREVYEDEESDPDVMRRLFESQRRAYRRQARRLTRVAGEAGSGLEIGSYVGGFLTAAGDLGWRFEGLDVNAPATRFAHDLGCSVRIGSLEDAPADRRYDSVAIWNCFDQLPDPRLAARAARSLLARGGILAIRVPNGRFYTRWRDRLGGADGPLARVLLSQNNLLGFPYRHGFTPDSLARLLESAEFQIVRTVGDVLVPLADGWTRPWAAAEERLVKGAIRLLAFRPHLMPWYEIYARAV